MIDHSNTFALLIGVSEFPEDTSISSIPNVVPNIMQFRSCLVDKNIVGIPEDQVFVSLNESKREVEKKLVDIAEKTKSKKSSLIVYYSGHGILSSKKYQLYLTTKETSLKYLELDSVPVDALKGYFRESRAGCKVMILDCCHSGAVLGQMGNIASAIRANIKAEGIYVMTSAAENMPALFPIEDSSKPTYFTGKMVEILKDGVVNAQEFLTVSDIYQQIESEFRDADLPLPQQSNLNNAHQFYISRNKGYDPKAPLQHYVRRDEMLKKTILRELNIMECVFVSFLISWMLCSFWVTYDDWEGWERWSYYEMGFVFDFLFVGYCLFYLFFCLSIRRLNVFVSKMIGITSFMFLAFLCYLLNSNDFVMDMEWDYMDADWSVSYKTFFLIPILTILSYPLKRKIQIDVFRFLLVPFLICFLVAFLFYWLPSQESEFDYIKGNFVQAAFIIFNFTILGFTIRKIYNTLPSSKILLLSIICFLIPFERLFRLINSDYLSFSFSYLYPWQKVVFLILLPAVTVAVYHRVTIGRKTTVKSVFSR